MLKKEGFHVLDEQNAAVREDKGKKETGLQPRIVVRKKLAYISNQSQNHRLLIPEKSQSLETTTKEYICQLQKENMDLVMMLAQNEKIIEHNGNEVDRLRVHLLKMHEQNQQLALSNSQMLVELNLGKDRLKMLQHELGCKNGLLKARKLDLKSIKSDDDVEFLKEGTDDEMPHRNTRSFQPNGESTSEQVESKDKQRKKRPVRRRQSARFKAAEVKPAEDLLEKNNTGVCASQSPEHTVCEQGSASASALVKPEGSTDGSGPEHESQLSGRSTLQRPSRAAAKKVQSYKEISVKVKLRRPE